MTLTSSWSELASLLASVAPLTARSLRPGLEPGAIAAARTASGTAWPPEYAEWFSVVNGWDRSIGLGELLPGHPVFSIDEAATSRRDMVRAFRIQRDEARAGGFGFGNAGEQAGMYLPEFLPLGGEGGWLLFCDAREGARGGCVTRFQSINDVAAPSFASIASMIDALLGAVTEGELFLDHRAVLVAGRLEWEFAPASTVPVPTPAVPTPAVPTPAGGDVVVAVTPVGDQPDYQTGFDGYLTVDAGWTDDDRHEEC